MIRLLLMTVTLSAAAAPLVYGQHFTFDGSRKKESMNFLMIKNLIIVPLYVNGKGPYNFILDTGVNPLIITDISILDQLDLKTLRTTKLGGLGEGNDLEAYLTEQIYVRMGSASMNNMPTAILKKDIFDLSSYVGIPIYGLVGYYFFNSFTVKIKYPAKRLTYYLPEVKVKMKGERIPLEMINNKPYVQLYISMDEQEKREVKMIMDIGASHAVSLESYEGKPFDLPRNTIKANLGVGFAGLISGHIGRLTSVQFGSKVYKNVLSSFPDFVQAGAKTNVLVRNGNIGSNLLRHFDLTIDYINGSMYVKPNSFSKATFEHDMSGMEVYLRRGEIDGYFVGRIEPESPAAEAGILSNDQLMSMNFKSIDEYSLDEIDQLLKAGEGKRVILQLARADKMLFKILILKRRI